MKGNHADLKNSAGRWGSACTAAAFLSQFVGGHPRWAHLDIAGVPPAISARPRQATGYGVASRSLAALAADSPRRRRPCSRAPTPLLDDLRPGDHLPGGGPPVDGRALVSRSRSTRGEMVGLVGESGSGKTMTALAVMRLVPAPGRDHAAARIRFDGQQPPRAAPSARCAQVRGGRIAMVFQEPMTALNPVFTIGYPDRRGAARPSRRDARRGAASKPARLLELVAMPDPGAGSTTTRTSSRAASASAR